MQEQPTAGIQVGIKAWFPTVLEVSVFFSAAIHAQHKKQGRGVGGGGGEQFLFKVSLVEQLND